MFIALKKALNIYLYNILCNIVLGLEDNVQRDLWSMQLVPPQSTERKKSCHSQTRLG